MCTPYSAPVLPSESGWLALCEGPTRTNLAGPLWDNQGDQSGGHSVTKTEPTTNLAGEPPDQIGRGVQKSEHSVPGARRKVRHLCWAWDAPWIIKEEEKKGAL